MTFDYYDYLRNSCDFCLIMLVFPNIFTLLVLFDIWRNKDSLSWKDILWSVIGVYSILSFFIHNFTPLYRGGIFLLKEKPEDAIQVRGVVTDRIEVDSIGKVRYYVDEYGTCWGENVSVDGERYYIVTCGDITIGDFVEMDVLPRSRCVLRIERVEENDP